MIIRRKFIFILILLICLMLPKVEASVSVSADSAILMEQSTKRIIYQKNIDEVHLTASICKILTAITAIEYGDLEKYVTVDDATTKQVGSSIYLKKGDQIKLKDLLYGLLLRSGNDAAYLIANSVCSSYDDFISLMNETAKRIGMTSSTFANPSGLDDETKNYSTARDMALLMCYAMNNKVYMEINGCKYHTATTFNGEKLYFINKHRLITSNDNVICGKTGYTQKAKRTLVTGAEKNNLKLVVVTFGSNNDFNEHMYLFNYGFDNYQMHTILTKQIIKVDNNLYRYTPVLLENITYPIKKDEVNRLKCIIYLYNNPNSSRIIGEATIYLDNDPVKRVNVYRYY